MQQRTTTENGKRQNQLNNNVVNQMESGKRETENVNQTATEPRRNQQPNNNN